MKPLLYIEHGSRYLLVEVREPRYGMGSAPEAVAICLDNLASSRGEIKIIRLVGKVPEELLQRMESEAL